MYMEYMSQEKKGEEDSDDFVDASIQVLDDYIKRVKKDEWEWQVTA